MALGIASGVDRQSRNGIDGYNTGFLDLKSVQNSKHKRRKVLLCESRLSLSVNARGWAPWHSLQVGLLHHVPGTNAK